MAKDESLADKAKRAIKSGARKLKGMAYQAGEALKKHKSQTEKMSDMIDKESRLTSSRPKIREQMKNVRVVKSTPRGD